MKFNKLFLIAIVGAFFAASCSDIDDIKPQGGTMLASQVQETNALIPSRASASFNGMFSSIGQPEKMYSNPDDWEFLMMLFCNDLEGPDAIIPDSGYNWFSVCGEYSSRNANYRNPAIRYRTPYNMIGSVNTFILSIGETEDPSLINMLAQVKVLRAYSYWHLVSNFQFNYQVAADKPSVPLVTEFTEDFTNNPRATVKEIYDFMLEDLDWAVEHLAGAERTTKAYVDEHVARGLRARVYLEMGEWQKAYDDAVAAAEGYTPATIEEVSKPSFYDISEHNWIWGCVLTTEMTKPNTNTSYATTSSWLRSFSGASYSAACQVYTCINTLLYNKIHSTDVRKGWWVDENLESPLLEGLAWPGFPDVANADDGGDSKTPYLPYTNVKFGCRTVGTIANDEHMPLMRVEEMILIQAECQARLGNTGQATSILTDFVKTYREPDYNVAERGLSLLDEIWFQRRVELWGEGFGIKDCKRLNKPLVRFHDDSNNQPAAFRFNLPADDPYLLMRFPQGELNTNFGIVDNTGGHQPVTDENKSLRDGVTD